MRAEWVKVWVPRWVAQKILTGRPAQARTGTDDELARIRRRLEEQARVLDALEAEASMTVRGQKGTV